MAEHTWSVLCKLAIINETSKSMSLIESFDRLNIRKDSVEELDKLLLADQGKKNGVFFPLGGVIASRWRRSDDDGPSGGEYRIFLRGPSEEALQKSESLPINFPGKNINYQPRFNLDLQRYVGLGHYKYLVQYRRGAKGRWTTKAKLHLQLSLAP